LVPWYEGGYRAQIVAYTCARLANLALDQAESGGINYIKNWAQQSSGPVLEEQIGVIGEAMARVLHNPPLPGQNISEWAKQPACRKTALSTTVSVVNGFEDLVITRDDRRAGRREQRAIGLIDRGLDSVRQVLARDSKYWESLRGFCRTKRILLPDDERALTPACQIPKMVSTDRRAARPLQLVERAEQAGWQAK